MIKTYHRPTTLDDALRLLARDDVPTVVLAGGTQSVATLGASAAEEVVDLQALGLDGIEVGNMGLHLGAMTTLQTMAEHGQLPAIIREAAHREGPNALRNVATMGGTIVTADPTSELLAALLVHEAQVDLHDLTGERRAPLATILADIPDALGRGLVTGVTLARTGRSAAARVARTPADAPIVAAVARRTPDRKMLLALCGVAQTPVLVDPDDVAGSIDPPGDFRGSAEYRRAMALTLTQRVLEEIG